MSKIIQIFLIFFIVQFRGMFFVVDIFLKSSIFKALRLLKSCLFFEKVPIITQLSSHLMCKLLKKLISIISYRKEPLICDFGEWTEDILENVSNEEVNPQINYCIGYSWPRASIDWYNGLQKTRYGCKKPCDGGTPCIR